VPSNLDLLDLAEVLRTYGRGVVFRGPRWDPETGNPIVLSHLGDTEGDMTFTPNAEVAALTLPELTGPAQHEGTYTGENPTLELPLFVADPSLLPILSPKGSAHAGRSGRTAVAEHTLVIFPEALFGESRAQLVHNAGAWTLGGEALTPAQLAILDLSVWLWRGYFMRPARRWLGGAGDASKNIEQVSFMVMHHPGLPEGHKLYTTGDPNDYGIDLEGGS
jgi:hypothetical protein